MESQDIDSEALGMARLNSLFKKMAVNKNTAKPTTPRASSTRARPSPSISHHTTQSSPNRFLDLPSELRLLIYYELLVTDDALVLDWRGLRKATKQQRRTHIGILMASKLCYEEGRNVLYGENVFDFGEICVRPANFVKPLITRVGYHNTSLIKRILTNYSMASEELYRNQLVNPLASTDSWGRKIHIHPLDPAILITTLHSLHIDLEEICLLGVSMIPYGAPKDSATIHVVERELGRSALISKTNERAPFLAKRNAPAWTTPLIEAIVDRGQGRFRASGWWEVEGYVRGRVGVCSRYMEKDWILWVTKKDKKENGEMKQGNGDEGDDQNEGEETKAD